MGKQIPIWNLHEKYLGSTKKCFENVKHQKNATTKKSSKQTES